MKLVNIALAFSLVLISQAASQTRPLSSGAHTSGIPANGGAGIAAQPIPQNSLRSAAPAAAAPAAAVAAPAAAVPAAGSGGLPPGAHGVHTVHGHGSDCEWSQVCYFTRDCSAGIAGCREQCFAAQCDRK